MPLSNQQWIAVGIAAVLSFLIWRWLAGRTWNSKTGIRVRFRGRPRPAPLHKNAHPLIRALLAERLPPPLPIPTADHVAATILKRSGSRPASNPPWWWPVWKFGVSVEWVYRVEVMYVVYSQQIETKTEPDRGPERGPTRWGNTQQVPTSAIYPHGLHKSPDELPTTLSLLTQISEKLAPTEYGAYPVVRCPYCVGHGSVTGPQRTQATRTREVDVPCAACKGKKGRWTEVVTRKEVERTGTNTTTCTRCGGARQVLDGYYSGDGQLHAGYVSCPACGGEGGWSEDYTYQDYETISKDVWEDCQPCGGMGETKKTINDSAWEEIPGTSQAYTCHKCSGAGFLTQRDYIKSRCGVDSWPAIGHREVNANPADWPYKSHGRLVAAKGSEWPVTLADREYPGVGWLSLATATLYEDGADVLKWDTRPEDPRMAAALDRWFAWFTKHSYPEQLEQCRKAVGAASTPAVPCGLRRSCYGSR
jgi:DNA-directed RNA polymerase subunit M/transcription elongation factor TFIIS